MALGRWTGVAAVVGAMTAAAGCAPVEATDGDGPAVAEIVQGDEARDLPFACTISTGRSICSGALVAPNVVLTAGHCVDGAGPWTVRCPYSRDTASVRGSVAVFAPNYPNRDDPSRASIDNDRGSDLGLIRLDRPLAETRVALLDASPLTTGRSVAAVGRIQSGTATSALWRSATFALTAHDRRNGYWGGVDRTIIEAGDSGGPAPRRAHGARRGGEFRGGGRAVLSARCGVRRVGGARPGDGVVGSYAGGLRGRGDHDACDADGTGRPLRGGARLRRVYGAADVWVVRWDLSHGHRLGAARGHVRGAALGVAPEPVPLSGGLSPRGRSSVRRRGR